MSVGQFEPPPRLGKRIGRVPETQDEILEFLKELEGAVIMTEQEEAALHSWLERYTKKVASET